MAHDTVWIKRWVAGHAEEWEAEQAARFEREHACHAANCDAYHVDDTLRCDNCGDYFCAAHLTTDDRWVYCGACIDEMRADEATLAPIAIAA